MEIHAFNSFLDIFNMLLYTTLSNQEKKTDHFYQLFLTMVKLFIEVFIILYVTTIFSTYFIFYDNSSS